MLDISPLSDMSLANIFFQSVACLLILLTLFSTEQKFVILKKSSLLMIFFSTCAFGILPKELSPYPRSISFSPMLSSRRFIVLCLYLGLWSILNWLFVCMVWVNCLYIWTFNNTSSLDCWKSCLFSTALPCTFVKNQLTIYVWVYF